MPAITIKRFAAVVCPVLLLAACTSPQQDSARVLQRRLQAQLGPQLANKQVAMQPLPDGAVITLNDPVLFSPDQAQLNQFGGFVVASVTESMLNPQLMQVAVSGVSPGPVNVRQGRLDTVRSYLRPYALVPSTSPPAPMPASGAPPTNIAIALHVHCPPGPQGSTWKYQVSQPTCD